MPLIILKRNSRDIGFNLYFFPLISFDQTFLSKRKVWLPINISHALAVGELPHHHKDPFDRILVAQAKVEGLTLVTRDENMKMYDIPFIAA